MLSIEIYVQFQDIYAGFSKKSKLAPLCMLSHERADFILTDAALVSHARNLKFRSSERNVRVQSRTGSRYQVCGNRSTRIVRLKSLDLGGHAIEKSLIGWSEIRSA